MTRLPAGARLLTAPLLVLLAACVLLGGAGRAQAVGYRYWSFWERGGNAWTYATQGPSTSRPADGDVQGFRFAVSEDSSDATEPRGSADFATICAGTPARGGQKRVALILDFGTAADAPSGERPPAGRTACARVPGDATTADALAAVAGPLRYDTNALLCAIAGYPAKGCGEQVTSGQDRAPAKGTDHKGQASAKSRAHHGPSVGLLAGAAAVAVLGAAAVWQARRRRG
ncbi:SCO2322 family protein [Streptomyces sp. NPDC001222]|uniref:SCO2322 family protein n=1 Tax=Streptomyces sp. NPDC001222 TaxID=3364548 RepID=UPI00369510B8